MKPLSRGFLKLRSTNPNDKPEIHVNYLSRKEDVQSLVEGIKVGRKLGQASAFDSFRGLEAVPGSDMQTDEQLAAKIRETAGGLFHPVGTCKMGTDPWDGAVVDSALRVHGVKGLRVVDASIMPVITTGNTNAPTVMIAEKAVDLIRQNCKKDEGYNMEIKDRSFLGILDRIAEGIESQNSGELPKEVRSDPREEVILRWAIGRGTLRADKKGVTFIEDVYKLNGQPDGHMVVSSETIVEDKAELIAQPHNPEVVPADPNRVEHLPAKSFGKVKWTRPDGSTLTALGVGNSNIVPLTGNDVITAEVLAMVITNGTGAYEGACGLWTSNHSILNPPGGTLLGSEGEFIRKQLHTIRVIKGINIAPPAPAPQSAGGSGVKGSGPSRPQKGPKS